MKAQLLFILLIAAMLSGCAQHYVMRLRNGSQIDAYGKPKLKGQTLHYKDGLGRQREISVGRVTEVAPASMAAEEQTEFKPPKPPRKRHWYFLWLAAAKPDAEPGLIAYLS